MVARSESLTRAHPRRFARIRSRRALAFSAALGLLAAALVLGVGFGSVAIAPGETIAILARRLLSLPIPQTWAPSTEAIVFRNRDDIPHIVVGANGEFHSKALDTDDTFAFTFVKAGTYAYFCGLHPQMQGRIVVTP